MKLAASGELQFDLAGTAPHRTDHNLHVMPQLGHELQQLGLADTAELPARDAGDLGLVDFEQRGGPLLRQTPREGGDSGAVQ